jgi:hypothetical protein
MRRISLLALLGVLAIAGVAAALAGRGGAPHDPVSASQQTEILRSLKTVAFPREFGPVTTDRQLGCADDILGAKRNADNLRVYLRLVCGGWKHPNCATDPGAPSASVPAVVDVTRGVAGSWRFPGDGSDYQKDINKLFPAELRKAAVFPGNAVVKRLLIAAEKDAGCQ